MNAGFSAAVHAATIGAPRQGGHSGRHDPTMTPGSPAIATTSTPGQFPSPVPHDRTGDALGILALLILGALAAILFHGRNEASELKALEDAGELPSKSGDLPWQGYARLHGHTVANAR